MDKKQNNTKNVVKNIFIVILLAIIGILVFLMFQKKPDIPQKPIDNGLITEEEIKFQEGNIENNKPCSVADDGVSLPVIQDFQVSNLRPYANLFNPKENEDKFIIRYTFSDTETDEILYQSDWLKPGFKYSVPFGEIFEVGEHFVKVTVDTKDMGDYSDKNGITTALKVTVIYEKE